MDMYYLHHNREEWIQPEIFNPERFNPESPFYLTPAGKKRHAMSFSPFLGGKRICLGKTFAETVSKVVGPTLIYNFDMEFVDKKFYKEKPANHLVIQREPVVDVKVTKNKNLK